MRALDLDGVGAGPLSPGNRCGTKPRRIPRRRSGKISDEVEDIPWRTQSCGTLSAWSMRRSVAHPPAIGTDGRRRRR